MESLRALMASSPICQTAGIVWLVLVNGLAIILMGLDKARARKGNWRIPEKTLFIVAFAGGSPGILCGIWLFRHKTRHQSFTWGIPLILLLQAGLLVAAAYL